MGALDNAYVQKNPQSYWRDVASLRLDWLRYDVRWDKIAATQPTNPASPDDPAYQWQHLDEFMVASAAYPGEAPKPGAVSEPVQATYVRDSLRQLRHTPRIERASWFILKDEPIHVTGRTTWQSGFRRNVADGSTRKPSFFAWRNGIGPLVRPGR